MSSDHPTPRAAQEAVMPVIFDEILFDLELKRAAALDPAHRRRLAERPIELVPAIVTIAGERVDAMPLVAAMTRDALAVLRTATSGDEDDPHEALVPVVAERVAERLRGRAEARSS